LGIDLEGLNGRDSNDAGDADVGPNHLQNFPIITNVVVSLAGVTFQGFLASAPNAPYAVEFFINPLCDSSASCEGQTFVGSTNLTTDATGTNFFSVTMSANVSCRFLASATATDTNNNTSELSVCRLSIGIDTDGDRACDAEEVLAGTDFNDPASVFRMTGITRQGNDIHVTWQAGGGRTNMLQTTIDLAECLNFSDLPPQVVLPDSGNLLLTNRLHIDGATNRSGFYRVRLVR
jgi:hypothetical protein